VPAEPHATGEISRRPLFGDSSRHQRLNASGGLGRNRSVERCLIHVERQPERVKHQKHRFIARVVGAVTEHQSCALETALGVDHQTPGCENARRHA